MGFFGLFGKKKWPHGQSDWPRVAGRLAGLLWHTVQTEPKMLTEPFARIILRDDWNVTIATDKCDADKMLDPNDISFVFLQEDRPALVKWVNDLKGGEDPMFQKMATEEYVWKLVHALRANIKVLN